MTYVKGRNPENSILIKNLSEIDQTINRATDVEYQNTSDKLLLVIIDAFVGGMGGSINLRMGSVSMILSIVPSGLSKDAMATEIGGTLIGVIPPNWYYMANINGDPMDIGFNTWTEYEL